MSTLCRFCLVIMLIGAMVTGLQTYLNLLDLSRTYAAAEPELRRFMLYGPNLPLLDKVERVIPQEDGILLEADVDPALLAYGLFPRPVWQPEVDPEMRVFFRGASKPRFPKRTPESFDVKWFLRVGPETLLKGGELYRLGHFDERH